MTTDDHGRVLVGFADGCTGACVTDPTQNAHDAYATIARQQAGRTLFARYDEPTGTGRTGTGDGHGDRHGHRHGTPGRAPAPTRPAAAPAGPARLTLQVRAQKRHACETKGFRRSGAWRLVRGGAGDHHKYCSHAAAPGARDVVSVGFRGDSATLAWGVRTGGGTGVVLVDGHRVGRVSFAGRGAAVSFRGHRRTFSGLGAGAHRLQLRLTGPAYLDYLQS